MELGVPAQAGDSRGLIRLDVAVDDDDARVRKAGQEPVRGIQDLSRCELFEHLLETPGLLVDVPLTRNLLLKTLEDLRSHTNPTGVEHGAAEVVTLPGAVAQEAGQRLGPTRDQPLSTQRALEHRPDGRGQLDALAFGDEWSDPRSLRVHMASQTPQRCTVLGIPAWPKRERAALCASGAQRASNRSTRSSEACWLRSGSSSTGPWCRTGIDANAAGKASKPGTCATGRRGLIAL